MDRGINLWTELSWGLSPVVYGAVSFSCYSIIVMTRTNEQTNKQTSGRMDGRRTWEHNAFPGSAAEAYKRVDQVRIIMKDVRLCKKSVGDKDVRL